MKQHKWHKDEALKMAIDCLIKWTDYNGNEVETAIKACKEALKQPTQEPVAWMNDIAFSEYKEELEGDFGKVIPLYTHPKEWQGLSDDEILKAIAPRGTADSDWNVLKFCDDLITIGRAIEQKLKEKNHGKV